MKKTSKKKSASSKKSSPRKKTTKKKTTRSKVGKSARRKATSKKRVAKKKTSKKAAKKRVTKKKTSKKKVTKKKVAKKKTSKKKVAKKKTSKAKATKASKKKAKTKVAKKAKVAKKTASKASKKTAAKGKKAAQPKEPAPPKVDEKKLIAEAMANLAYGEGSHVVHPKYGLGKVQRIVDRTLTERTVPCLEIHFSYHDMKLTIPVDQVDRSGLRKPISKKDTNDVFKVLKGRATFDAKRRSAKRVADYQKRVRQGDPLSLAEVVRDLSRLALKKTLSYEERKILSEALRILSREVALAKGRNPEEVLLEIERIVNR